jgi:hypothetical protein
MSDLVDAIETFKWRPETLTTAQVALLTKADPALGAQARRTVQEHAIADAVVTAIKGALAQPTQRIAQLEAELAALRLLVEADQAARELVP